MTEVPTVQAQLAWWPLMFLFALGLLAAFAAVAVVGARKGPAGGVLLGLLVCAGVFLAVFGGYGLVGTQMAPHLAPATVVYVQPTPMPLPISPAPQPALPPGSGMTAVPGYEEPLRHAVEAPRPSSDASVSAPTSGTPEWVAKGPVRTGDKTFFVVSGQQYADAAAARQDAVGTASEAVRHHFRLPFHPVFDHWYIDPNAVRAIAVRDEHTEAIRRTAGENEFTVYRTHLRVELSPPVREAIDRIWRDKISTELAKTAGGLFAFLTAVAAVLAAYFRLDDRTAGRYRWRLRLGSVAAVALAGGIVSGGVAAVPIGYVPVPVTPVPAETPDEPSIEVAPPAPPQAPLPDEVSSELQAGFSTEHPFEVGADTDCPND